MLTSQTLQTEVTLVSDVMVLLVTYPRSIPKKGADSRAADLRYFAVGEVFTTSTPPPPVLKRRTTTFIEGDCIIAGLSPLLFSIQGHEWATSSWATRCGSWSRVSRTTTWVGAGILYKQEIGMWYNLIGGKESRGEESGSEDNGLTIIRIAKCIRPPSSYDH